MGYGISAYMKWKMVDMFVVNVLVNMTNLDAMGLDLLTLPLRVETVRMVPFPLVVTTRIFKTSLGFEISN